MRTRTCKCTCILSRLLGHASAFADVYSRPLWCAAYIVPGLGARSTGALHTVCTGMRAAGLSCAKCEWLCGGAVDDRRAVAQGPPRLIRHLVRRSSDRQVPSDTLRRVKARRTPAALRREQTRGGRSIARVCPCGCAQPGRVVSGTSLFRPTRLGAGSTRSKPCWKPKVRRAAVPTEARADRLVPAVAATEHCHSAQCGRMGRASAHTALTGSRPGSVA
jgi:hypothetical protein